MPMVKVKVRRWMMVIGWASHLHLLTLRPMPTVINSPNLTPMG